MRRTCIEMIAAKIIATNEQAVIRNAETLPARIHQAMKTGLSRGLQIASEIAQREFLSGPRPSKLAVRTGRLRNSIATSVEDRGQDIVGRIGSNVSYAAFHEFGFHGMMNVKAHTRVSRIFSHKTGQDVEIRRTSGSKDGSLRWFKETRLQALLRVDQKLHQTPGFNAGMVSPHTRKINYAGRPFIRPALQKALPQIATEVNKELATVNK